MLLLLMMAGCEGGEDCGGGDEVMQRNQEIIKINTF